MTVNRVCRTPLNGKIIASIRILALLSCRVQLMTGAIHH